MKLLRCHIENFGKLSDFDYKFEDGINMIKEENGFGKTTFASFIKAMFYGLEIKRNTKMLIDRKKYQPWQGGAFGGNIEFEIENKKYKIERFFGKKESDDTFKIYDLTTNLESNDYTQNIGEEIFKLNKEAYDRSTFISGQNMETSMNDSINAKLGNILENENDINTSEQAIKILEEAIKNYKKTGGRGEINEKILEKTKLEQKLEQSKIDEKSLQERKDKNDELKQELKKKIQEQENLKKLLTQNIEQEAKNAKLENYRILQNNVKECKKKLVECEQFFESGILTDDEIETLIEKSFLIEKYRMEFKNYEIGAKDSDEIENLRQLFQNKEISEDIINNKISEYNNLNEIKNKIELNEEKNSNLIKEKNILIKQRKKEKNINFGLGLCSIIFIIIGVIFLIKSVLQIGLPTLILGILGSMVFLVKSIALKKKDKDYLKKEKEIQELSKLQQNLKEENLYLQNEIEKFIKQYTEDKSNLDSVIILTEIKTKFIKYKELKHNINSIFEKQNEIAKKLNELEQGVRSCLLKYFKEISDSYVTYAQEIKMKKNELTRLKQDYETNCKIKEEYEKVNNIEDLESNRNDIELLKFDKNQIKEEIENLTTEINKLNDEKNYNKNQIEILESNLDTVFDIENELEELNTNIQKMKDNCEILEKTKKYLETAKNQFSSRYLSRMKESFIKYLRLINGQEINANLDVKLKVQINEQGSNKEVNYFSTGYKDLIYICMRLSLIDSLFEEEKPFIILDDPFVNLDEGKIKNATKLLQNISKNYQILYFICHGSRQISY